MDEQLKALMKASLVKELECFKRMGLELSYAWVDQGITEPYRDDAKEIIAEMLKMTGGF